MTEAELPDSTDGGAPAAASESGDGPGTGGEAPRRRPSPRWLAGGFAALLAAVLGLVLFWQFSEPAACAAALAAPPLERLGPMVERAGPPVGATVYKGKASHYDGGGSGGNCSLPGPPANRLYVALGSSQYAGSAACGSFLDVTGPKGTVRVMVLDRCAGCTNNKIDLSRQAFAKIADLSQGIVPVRYRAAVDPPLSGPLTFRLKSGVSQYWFAVQVGNHGNPVKSVAAKRGGSSWRAAKRGSDNYWVIDGGIGPGPYSIRVTDVYGHQAVATGIRLAPRQVQRGTVRMYDPTPAAAGSPSPSASSVLRNTPAPSASPTSDPATPTGADPSGQPVAAAGRPGPVGCG
ncbi:expansin EXLX1 family cellulose-binding protein [Plantactinospora sp. KLBMP9567]|uniref:expansin EXLX1 family cellulose-binding protein n=1 Tax=Plantactinospora sp. KLBMP9567 TaxID=3085900 RepID=UPI002981B292|nr:expansin EXLX1 family cellulose-binding protein [Plantactinospora sp. KLBMP9567]MDW5329808.1 expansin EXLX1 family cellulose-binding protein [Plantactinospora sp. KLBMP9567]